MFHYLSKFLPLFVYPLGLACGLLGVVLCLRVCSRWRARLVAVALALLWLGGNRVMTMVLLRSLEWRYLPPSELPSAEIIVVLGGGTRTRSYPRPANELNEAGDRLLYAARLYHQGAAPLILVTGGNAEWTGPALAPEAEAMTEILTMLGVPSEVILRESKSRNTYENFVESKKILEQRDIQSLILVTSAMHMPRAYRIFTQSELIVYPAPADFLLTEDTWTFHLQPDMRIQLLNLMPRAGDLYWTSLVLKEYLGILVYGARGWL